MARINIEDEIFKDDSFVELLLKFGCKTMAIGAVVETFILAQKHFKDESNGRLIPFKEWEKFKHSQAIFESGLAVKFENGIYVRGSKEQFKWLLQKINAGKSKSEAKINQLKKAREAKKHLNGSERLKTELNVSEPPTPTPTPTHSHTPTILSKFQKNEITPSATQAKPDSFGSNIAIGLYYDLYKEKYSGKAPLTGKHYSLIKNIIKSNGLERTNQLLEAYFQMPDAYFIKKRHDIETFNFNLNQVAHFADTGAIITNQQVKQADTQIANQQLLKAYEGKK
jgi:hypothetical protein